MPTTSPSATSCATATVSMPSLSMAARREPAARVVAGVVHDQRPAVWNTRLPRVGGVAVSTSSV